MTEEKFKKLDINIDDVFKAAFAGIRRCYVFLNIGMASKDRIISEDIHLKDETGIQMFPQSLEEPIEDIKNNFSLWVIGNGLRELVESFGYTLNEVYKICVLSGFNRIPLTQEALNKIARYCQIGELDRLKTIQKEFGIQSGIETHLERLIRARNCLTHRWGMVSQQDCTESDAMKISWCAPELFLLNEDGSETIIPMRMSIDSEGIHVKAGQSIFLRWAEKQCSFYKGSILRLDAEQVRQICLMMFSSLDEMKKSLLEHLKSKNILPTRIG